MDARFASGGDPQRPRNVLKIDVSPRGPQSVSRQLTGELVARLGESRIVERDLSGGVPVVTADWIGAAFTEAGERSEAQRAALALSDELIAELDAADVVVIGLPMWNFGPPAAFKAWIDQIARAKVTFRYGESGPVGLLRDRPVYVVVASGGVPVGSAVDFLTPWLRQVLGFVGLKTVTVIDASGLNTDAAASLARARDTLGAVGA